MFRLIFVAAILAGAVPAAAQTNPHAGHAGQSVAQQASPNPAGVVTSPSDGSMLSAAPTRFSLTFPHPMTLKTLSVTAVGAAAVMVPVPEAAPSADVSVALPISAPGTYAAGWTAVGEDGHQMSGVVRYMVH